MISFHKQMADLLTGKHRFDLSCFEESFVEMSVQSRVTKTGLYSAEEYLRFLSSNKKEQLQLIESLRNNYSEFFRNGLTFSVLDRIVLPALIRQKEKKNGSGLRIWSAGCASGQEAYSLAILMEEHKAGSHGKLKYQIFATDNNEDIIGKARTGTFNTASIGNLPLRHLNRWFTCEGETFTVLPGLKTNIEFSLFDMLNDRQSTPPTSIYGDFDIVFCANMLFYYNRKSIDHIVARLTGSLAGGGFLVTGEAEREILAKRKFSEVYPQSAIFTLNRNPELQAKHH
jgi:chemotaxis methyl-accepting protein methylase